MRLNLIKISNSSTGIIIPKALIQMLEFKKCIKMEICYDRKALILHPIERWEECEKLKKVKAEKKLQGSD